LSLLSTRHNYNTKFLTRIDYSSNKSGSLSEKNQVIVCTCSTGLLVVFDIMVTAGGTQTVAVKQTDGSYKLYGYKWFSSATDADMALTLARICDEHGCCTEVMICTLSPKKNCGPELWR